MNEQDTTAARDALAAVVRLSSGLVPWQGSHGPVVFLESAGHLEFGLGLRGAEGVVFSPGDPGTEEGVLGYEGGLAEPGDEFLAADTLFVYTQDYLATPFLAVAGPTIVRIGSAADYSGFLEDADLARAKGTFVEQLLHPGVFLADQCALGSAHPCPGTYRLHVSASGEVRTAPGGRVLGTVTSQVPFDAGDEPCLAEVVEPEVLRRERARRPWLSRYLRAVEVLRDLRAAGRHGYTVSGFGHRLTPGLPVELDEPADAPLLLWNDEEHLVCDLVRERVFRVGADAAKLVELLLTGGSPARACELAATHLGLDAATTADALDVLTGKLAGTALPVTGAAA
ncbi:MULTISPECIES: daptide biosynthesis RiPP recognition protein [Amycolatopsis]|uniref:Uncharacterized protein n=2 Tax=Amycolatopsis TaxID=1813 RepID=A0A1I4DFD3_9PSEU|nr:daptide biosynthesis RiPP recognition protein [Amycolatopsis sacchari]SFK92348.1 hypothetical protein SAMN05421835_14619 [Amycolatopsis sacchari]